MTEALENTCLPDPVAAEPAARHRTTGVLVGAGKGAIRVGGGTPIVVQSMTNTDTADVESTAKQVAALAQAGSELVRITVDRDEAAAAVPHIRSGRVRPLAVTGLQRHPLFKDLPTLDESGFKGFDAQQWYGVVGPAGIPAVVVKHLNDTLAGVLTAPDLREKLAIEAVEPNPMSPDAFGAFMRADIARWTTLAKARNIQLDS